MARWRTRVEELPDDKVRLTVDVPGADVHHAVEHAASDLASSVKIPGFRKGKVPMPVLRFAHRQRGPPERSDREPYFGLVLERCRRERIRPVEQPELDYELPDSEDNDWHFTATVSVLPKAEVADWTKLQVPYAEPELPVDLVDHELNVLRSTVAELTPAEGRPAALGDTVVVDLITDDSGERGLRRRARLWPADPGARGQLVGMSAGRDEGDRAWSRPARPSRSRSRPSSRRSRRKVLPSSMTSSRAPPPSSTTLDELRADIEQRIREQIEAEVNEVLQTRCARHARRSVRRSRCLGRSSTRARERSYGSWMPCSSAAGGSLETYIQMSGDFARGSDQASARPRPPPRWPESSSSRPLPTSSASRSRTKRFDEAFRDRFEESDKINRAGARRGRLRHGAREHAALARPRPYRRRGRAASPPSRPRPAKPSGPQTRKSQRRDETMDPGSKEPALT